MAESLTESLGVWACARVCTDEVVILALFCSPAFTRGYDKYARVPRSLGHGTYKLPEQAPYDRRAVHRAHSFECAEGQGGGCVGSASS